MVAEKIAPSNVRILKAENTSSKIDYNNFLSTSTKQRTNNYLRIISDKIFQSTDETFSFATGNPHPISFPYDDITLTLKNGESVKISGKPLEDSLSYLCTAGYDPLLNILKAQQDKFHGKQDWSAKEITTTSGILGGLHQFMDMCINKGDPVIVHTPFYPGIKYVLNPHNAEIIETENDNYGICPIHLRSVLEEREKKNLPMPKIFYVNPTGTNPTGEVIPVERKYEIYQIACDYNLIMVEDDPYYLLYYGEDKVTSFLAIDTEKRVLRFDSFSKTLGAGYRMGYVTGPKELIDKLNVIKESSNIASPFCQVVLYYTLKSMGFDGFVRHMKMVKEFYHRNCQIVLKSLDKYFTDIAEWKVPEAAMFVWIKIKNVDDIPQSFIEKCMKKSVFCVPGVVFYAKERKIPYLRLAFSQVDEKVIVVGIERLSRLVREELLRI